MSERALEFVETWVTDKIEETDKLPAEGDDAATKALADACYAAALEDGIPATEIQEAFDNLAEFIGGEIEEERERREGEPDGEDAELLWKAENVVDEEDDDDKDDK
jgi:hypothetical protein